MNEVRFRIAISASEFQQYYQGAVDTIIITTAEGKSVQLPVGALLKFVDHSGIRGSFRVLYDNNNKLLRVERLSS